MAVKEMNGIEINGKSVNVRLVKTPGEYTSPLSYKNGNKVTWNNLERNTNKEITSVSSISRLPRTRPRQLGSEQDSEFFPFEQKVSFLDGSFRWSLYKPYCSKQFGRTSNSRIRELEVGMRILISILFNHGSTLTCFCITPVALGG